ncbi:hypothetical protein BBO99_00001408 [Phytophthora kernoviae]|uniref:Uncharacterized protein n=2 Tax=Phytophthora kernoviae TaxID=325452 RepID=A0A421H056_9STRA|nr:hypothetical protein G195_002174 [Phytophthora kernoviae 00238/432]KAG2530594.1 hypothetical protein JM16_000896 [Phytophthora kernoviae]KAG2531322.1 hypothetical protein JM18_001675 [Phytophthora kernoviae]RLN26181.1 hypothetical protein BBI17_001277 [Phytophthora kernoviae]RLN84363.1 hypothetical protein BBO99_00001408 [Phytophthora kernoviae]
MTGGYALYGTDAATQGPYTNVESGRAAPVSEHVGMSNSNDDMSMKDAIQRTKESFRDTVLDLYAASKVFCIQLITFEGLFVVVFAVVTTSLYYFLGESSSGGPSFGANISWTIVSFAVVSPMIMQIRQAFLRREQALDAMAEARALLVNIMLANALWNWGDNGRRKLPMDYVQKTKLLLEAVLHDTIALLLMPTLTRGRHRFTSHGQKLALSYSTPVNQLQLRIVNTIRQLHEQVEVMKFCGMPANEASRINQYHWLLQARIEKLQNIKFYRTPQATRSFTRLFILVLPVFYGPYYAYIARGNGSQATNFGFCLMLSIATSLLMTGIFNVEKAMEDPFVGGGMDGVHVHEMFQLTHQMLHECYNEKMIQVEHTATVGQAIK